MTKKDDDNPAAFDDEVEGSDTTDTTGDDKEDDDIIHCEKDCIRKMLDKHHEAWHTPKEEQVPTTATTTGGRHGSSCVLVTNASVSSSSSLREQSLSSYDRHDNNTARSIAHDYDSSSSCHRPRQPGAVHVRPPWRVVSSSMSSLATSTSRSTTVTSSLSTTTNANHLRDGHHADPPPPVPLHDPLDASTGTTATTTRNHHHHDDSDSSPPPAIHHHIVAELVLQDDHDDELQREVERLREQVQASRNIPTAHAEIWTHDENNPDDAECPSHHDGMTSRRRVDQTTKGSLPTHRRRRMTSRMVLLLTSLLLLLASVLAVLWLVPLGNDSPQNKNPNENNKQDPGSSDTITQSTTIMNVIANQPELQSLHRHLVATGLDQTIQGLEEEAALHNNNNTMKLTVVAPTNHALAHNGLLMDFEQPHLVVHLRNLLQKHIWMDVCNETKETASGSDDDDDDGQQTFVTLNGESVWVLGTGRANSTVGPALADDSLGVMLNEPIVTAHGHSIFVAQSLIKPDFADYDLVHLAESLNLTATLDWVDRAGYANLIGNGADVTILAPSNLASSSLDPEMHDALWNDEQGILQTTVLVHVLGKYLPMEAMRERAFKAGLDGALIGGLGDTVFLRCFLGDDNSTISLQINNGRTANIIMGDQLARNGIIHVVDDFLVPDGLTQEQSPNLSV